MVYGEKLTTEEAALVASGLDNYNTFTEVHDEISRRQENSLTLTDHAGRPNLDLELGVLRKKYAIAVQTDAELTQAMFKPYPEVESESPISRFRSNVIFKELSVGEIDLIQSKASRKAYAEYFAEIGEIEYAKNLYPAIEEKLPEPPEKKLTGSAEDAYHKAIAVMAEIIAEKSKPSLFIGGKLNKNLISTIVIQKCQERMGVDENDKCGLSNLERWIGKGQSLLK